MTLLKFSPLDCLVREFLKSIEELNLNCSLPWVQNMREEMNFEEKACDITAYMRVQKLHLFEKAARNEIDECPGK